MSTYDFAKIEKKWQQSWKERGCYKVEVDPSKPKFYVLDMFPYPSGAGLHVGHPLGYIASDIYSRYKRQKGFNVLHPMGYDAFGLPAEQYAIQTGTHPAVTTDKNIARYREQLDIIGFSYDWDREVRTCDPEYYHWTQWAFIQMFESWYDSKLEKARPVADLIAAFEKSGSTDVDAACTEVLEFTSADWKSFDEKEQAKILLNYRLAYLAETKVNWCPELGTVLANDEVKDGVSVRGGHPVVQKEMVQWSLRITAYAKRLLDDLETLQWSDSLKEIQKNWIGKSIGGQFHFPIEGHDETMEIFTTRPDTIFGCTFMVLAPESPLVDIVTKADQEKEVAEYIEYTQSRTERDRIADVKSVTGVFSGAYALNPFNGTKIPIWIADYVLAGYGTGAIMAVPAHDSRDFSFAKKFDLPIIPVIEIPGADYESESHDAKTGVMINSDFITGMEVKDGINAVIDKAVEMGIGKKQINYRLRDAIFSRQRYWGEPFPVYFKEGIPVPLSLDQLPLELPEVDKYLPTESGEPPLARAKNWKTADGYPLELSTMPGFAGSSAYYLRYMDPGNRERLVSREANEYWRNVDLYVGGTEHATGHLIYSRFWNKFLFDIGEVCEGEPFKKLVNQGMIQGRSSFVYRKKGTNTFVSKGLIADHEVTEIHVDIHLVHNDILDQKAFKAWRPEFNDAQFILEDGQYICGWAIEKMSKSMYNVENPDIIVRDYGADTLRLYEMFLGPIQVSKPWTTEGITGVQRFLEKIWRVSELEASTAEAPAEVIKVLHQTIKKVSLDMEDMEFNTAISQMMIFMNEISREKVLYPDVWSAFVRLLSPFAPHIAEELWEKLGNKDVIDAAWPDWVEELTVENEIEIVVQVNSKVRDKIHTAPGTDKQVLEEKAMASEKVQDWISGKEVKRIIIIPDKIVNIVAK
jgi:leucyl-tRNA synthetase